MGSWKSKVVLSHRNSAHAAKVNKTVSQKQVCGSHGSTREAEPQEECL